MARQLRRRPVFGLPRGVEEVPARLTNVAPQATQGSVRSWTMPTTAFERSPLDLDRGHTGQPAAAIADLRVRQAVLRGWPARAPN